MKNQTFGIEIETTGIGRERTAKAIAAHFGTTARHIGLHLDDWKVPMPDGRHWTVERDVSVTAPSPACWRAFKSSSRLSMRSVMCLPPFNHGASVLGRLRCFFSPLRSRFPVLPANLRPAFLMVLCLLSVRESAAPFQVLEQRLPGSFEIGAAKSHPEQPAAHEVLFCFRLLALRVYAVRDLGKGDHLSFGMPFITLKAQKVKRMQAYLSFRGTASKSMLDIAWVAAIAPVTVSVGREHLPAVQAGAFVERLRALPNRLRVFRPPFPAARVRAEFSLASTAGLYRLCAAAQAGFRRFESRPGAYPGQLVRDTVISNRIATDSQLCRNRPIAQIPAPQRLNLLALLICQRYTNRSF